MDTKDIIIICQIVLLAVIFAVLVYLMLTGRKQMVTDEYGRERIVLRPGESLDSQREKFNTDTVVQYDRPSPVPVPIANGLPGNSHDLKHPFKMKRNPGNTVIFRPKIQKT